MSKRITLYVPQSFKPVETLPPRLLTHAQAACYLIHILLTKYAHGKRKFVVLNRDYLRADLGRRLADDLNNAMLKSGDIVRVVHPGTKKPVGYLPGHRFESDPLRPFRPTDPHLIQKIEQARQRIKQHRQKQQDQRERPADQFWRQWQDSLTVDMPHAERLISDLPAKSNRYDAQRLLVTYIQQRRLRYIIDRYGRVHNSISSLHSSLRQARERLSSIDIKNSQPALLAGLIRNKSPLQRAKNWVDSMVDVTEPSACCLSRVPPSNASISVLPTSRTLSYPVRFTRS